MSPCWRERVRARASPIDTRAHVYDTDRHTHTHTHTHTCKLGRRRLRQLAFGRPLYYSRLDDTVSLRMAAIYLAEADPAAPVSSKLGWGLI